MKKRKRGRPEVLPDYLFAIFQQVEAERYRHPNLSVSRICELIAKRFAAVINVRTGKKAEITTGRTLRSRYQEVLSALSHPPRGDYRRAVTLDDALLTRPERIIDQRTGKPIERVKILGQWGATRKLLQARRRASLLARRQLHGK
jgi:hypothetical protein